MGTALQMSAEACHVGHKEALWRFLPSPSSLPLPLRQHRNKWGLTECHTPVPQ